MGGSANDQVIGYKYYAGVQLVPCLGPVDAVLEIQIGERVAWTGNITSTQNVNINKPELFGGTKREGGVAGVCSVAFGDANQGRDAYLAMRIGTDIKNWATGSSLWDSLLTDAPVGSDGLPPDVLAPPSASGTEPSAAIPAYRGVLSLIFKRFYWSAMNPYFKKVGIKIRRITSGWGSEGVWYSAKAAITIDGTQHMNPAHILYQTLTDTDWGLGYPRNVIDDAAFRAAADTLHSEGFGISIVLGGQTTAKQFIQEILDHVNGALGINHKTGKFTLKLMRHDYDANALIQFDESNTLAVTSFQRRAWGETINELTVSYTDVNDGQVKSITMQDLANIQSQGAVVTESLNRVGLPTADLAARVCARELRVLSAPLAQVDLTVSRAGFDLGVGDCFKLSWADYGIESLIFRITSIGLGSLTNGAITISAVEDVFGMPDASYLADQPSGWIPPSNTAPAVGTFDIFEAPYAIIMPYLSSAEKMDLDPHASFAASLAARPTTAVMGYNIATDSASNGQYKQHWGGSFAPLVVLTADVGRMDTTFAFSGYGLTDAAGRLAKIGDEWVQIVSVNANNGTCTVKRAVADSIPLAHAQGAYLWVVGTQGAAIAHNEWLINERPYVKLQPYTGQDSRPFANITAVRLDMKARIRRPYPPANVRLGLTYFPEALTGQFRVDWNNRNKDTQADILVGFTEGNTAPAGDLRVAIECRRASNNSLLVSRNDIKATENSNRVKVQLAFTGAVKMVIWAIDDYGDSYFKHEIIFDYEEANGAINEITGAAYEP